MIVDKSAIRIKQLVTECDWWCLKAIVLHLKMSRKRRQPQYGSQVKWQDMV